MKPFLEVPGYRKVYKALRRFGDDGATVADLVKALNNKVEHRVITARLTTMLRAGLVRQAGITARSDRMAVGSESVNVWVAVDAP